MSELQVEQGAAWLRGQLREPYARLLAQQVLTGVVALLANLLLTRSLTPANRGEVALLLQLVYLGSQVLLLGTERSFVAGFHHTATAAAVRAYARLLIVPGAVGLTAAVLFALAAPHRLNPGPVVIALLAGYAFVEAAGLASRSIAIAAGRVGDLLRSRVAEAVLLLILLVALFRLGITRPEAWIAGYLLAGALPTIAYTIRWLRLPPVPAALPPPGSGRLVRREGLALFPAALSNMAMLRADRLALPALASTSALGLYASVATMTELLAWPLRAYADSRLGRWRAEHRSGALRTRPLVAAAALYALLVVPVVAGGLYLLIVPLFGAGYAPAKAVVVPLVAAAGLYAVSRISLGLLIAKGRGGLVSAAEIAGFTVSLVAYLLLIPRFGIVGAAYGSLLGYGTCLLVALAANRTAGS